MLTLVGSRVQRGEGTEVAEAVGFAMAGRKLLEEHVNALMPALLANLGFRADAEVRIAALQCLVVTMELPYNLLHAHKPAVLKALAQAVDDPKRAVRMQAARTRRLWMPVFKAATAM